MLVTGIYTNQVFGYETGDNDILGGSSPSGKPGGVQDATYNSTTGCVEFSGSQDNEWFWPDFQFGHGMDLSAQARPHIHLIWPTANNGKNSRWKLELNYAPLGGVLGATYGTFAYTETITVASPSVAGKHSLGVFPALAIVGQTVSTVVNARLTRLANTDILDDDTNMIAVKSMDFHAKFNGFGHTVAST